tara:strand:+ start:619 stop:753 length:135 start_codon:yes stop_codon:yes gene_type:complete
VQYARELERSSNTLSVLDNRMKMGAGQEKRAGKGNKENQPFLCR